MNSREKEALCLVGERFNANELAEALQVTRQSALAIMRRIDRKRLRKLLFPESGASKLMGADLRIWAANTASGD